MAVFDEVKNYTMLDFTRINCLRSMAATVVEEGIPGDIVEMGVCRGGSAAVMAMEIKNTDKRLWLYDTFEGIPEPTEPDGHAARPFAGAFKGFLSDVQTILDHIKFDMSRVDIRKGLFTDTLKEDLPEKISILHIDADWYESVLEALCMLAHRVSKGGFIVLDDFGHWEGCRKAFYHYCRAADTYPLVERNGYTQLSWRAGKEHNRNGS